MRNLMEANQKIAIAPAAIAVKNAAVDVMQFLDSNKGKLRQIELLTIFTAILLFFFIFFGSYRRCCSHDVFRLICFMAYKLSTYVLTYTLTLVRQTPFNDLFPHWLGYLTTILDSADSFSAFSLEDNEQWKSYSWQRAIKLFWVYWLLELSPNPAAAMALNWLFFILALRANDRAEALRAASQRSLESNAKIVADYMSEEHKNPAEVDPVGMTGYNYLVSGEEKIRAPFYVRVGRYILRRIKRIGPCWTTKKEAALAPGDQTPLDNEDQLITVEKLLARLFGSTRASRLNQGFSGLASRGFRVQDPSILAQPGHLGSTEASHSMNEASLPTLCGNRHFFSSLSAHIYASYKPVLIFSLS